MSVEQSQPESALPSGTAENVDVEAIERRAKDATWGSHRGRPEVYVKSPRVARVGAGLLAVFVAAGTVRWAWAAVELFRPDELVAAGRVIADWYRWTQLILAIAGIAVAAVTFAYLTYFAATGRIWRRWRTVAVTFGALAAVWTILWLIAVFL
jgi:hypothetical protein